MKDERRFGRSSSILSVLFIVHRSEFIVLLRVVHAK
jgi:hypothetical protein